MIDHGIICFDLDGTLTDPYEGLTKSFEFGLDAVGIPHGPRSELAMFIGPPLVDAVCEHYKVDRATGERFLIEFRRYFEDKGWCDNKVYDGIPELLSKLKEKGKRIALATSKPTVFSRKILELFGIARFFDVVSGADAAAGREKKTEVLSYALSFFDIRDGAVLVGDRKYDADGAKNIGIDSIGVMYGYGSRDEILDAGFTAVVGSVRELSELLLG